MTTLGLLLLVELGLAALGVRPIVYDEDPYVGFSSRVPLFVEIERRDGGGSAMVTARNKLEWFNLQIFPRQKPAGTFRVFCLGGSTTYGHPYEDSTSFCGWLREILPAADGSRKWELINAGGISYASYRVATLMEELTRYDPDLFVVYSGHNEFLEERTYRSLIEMPAAVRGLGAVLSATRIYSALRRFVRSGRRAAPAPGPGRGELPAEVETLLDVNVGPEAYRRDDELRKRILSHFRFNLSRMVDIARSAGAAVIFVKPASNLRDFSPFKSEHRAGLSAAETERWKTLFARARRAGKEGRPAEALRALEEAAAIDQRHAETWYERGRVLLELARPVEAKEAFVRARDEDICPLRALTRIEAIVGEVAGERGVPLVDFVALVEDRSADGIPGETLFLDHVHPTLEANRLLALSILETMTAMGIARPAGSWGEEPLAAVVERVESRLDSRSRGLALRNLAKVLGWAGKVEEAERLALEALALVPEGDADTHYGAAIAYKRRGQIEEALAHYQETVRLEPDHALGQAALGDLYWRRGDHERARSHLEAALRIRPRLPYAIHLLGTMLEDDGDLAGAAACYERALAARPKYAEAHNSLGGVRERLGDLAAARQSYERSLEIEPDFPAAHANLGRVLALEGDADGARKHLEKAIELDGELAEACGDLGTLLYRQGDSARAKTLFEQALKIKPDYAEAHNNLGLILAGEGRLVEARKHFEAALRSVPDYAGARRNLERVKAALGQ
ncbi:MAG: tetratricopeptide repeat protein [Planctomycetes bacterium]|nr:tetratricopeptide repeat protein [Planctomycetota bacterium]